MKDIDRTTYEKIWDALAPSEFTEAELHPINVDGHQFHKLHLSRGDTPSPVRIELHPAMYGMPRFAAYRYRSVLFPKDVLLHGNRWELRPDDILPWLDWARRMDYIVTFSTHKAGGSVPQNFHAQTFPYSQNNRVLSALANVRTQTIIPRNCMPRYESLEIATLQDYPLRGLLLTGHDPDVARKVYELALCYDNLKAFNIVISPRPNANLATFFFPRRRDGRATYPINGTRWQIAALEANGLMQAKTVQDLKEIDEHRIRAIFTHTGLSQPEFDDFLKLLETF